MSSDSVQQWVIALGAAGIFGLLASLVRAILGWVSGASQRRMRHLRDAISAMTEAGEWASAYWSGRKWCSRHHVWDDEYTRGYPPPPESDIPEPKD